MSSQFCICQNSFTSITSDKLKVHNLKSHLAKSRSFAMENPSLTCHKIVVWENSLFQMFCKLGHSKKWRAKDRGEAQ